MSNENHVADLKEKQANKEDRCEMCEEKARDFTEVKLRDTRKRLFVCDDCLEKGLYNNDLVEVE